MRPSIAGVEGLVLDCYGTIMTITDDRRVTSRFRRLIGDRNPTRSPLTSDATLRDALLDVGVDRAAADALEADAAAEARSARPIPGAHQAIAAARRAGLAVAIASNLSMEYAEPIRHWFPDVPAVLSFEVGAAKPHPAMWAHVVTRIGTDRLLMVGDSRRCDHDGAIAFGLQAVLVSGNPIPGASTIRSVADLPRSRGWS